MADKTGNKGGHTKEMTREAKGVGSRRSLEPRYVLFFYTLLTFITYKLRHTCYCYHCTPPPPSPPCQSRRRPHDTSKWVHTKGPRRPTKANTGQPWRTANAGPQQPTTAVTSPYASRHTHTITRTRVSYILYISFFYIFCYYFSCNIYCGKKNTSY